MPSTFGLWIFFRIISVSIQSSLFEILVCRLFFRAIWHYQRYSGQAKKRGLGQMGHFQVALKRDLVHNRSDENEFNLHAKGWAPRLPLGKRQKVILKWPVGSSLKKFLFSCFLRQHWRISIISLSLLFWTNFPTTYDFLPTFWESTPFLWPS